MKVLVVDDEKDIRSAIQKLLKLEGMDSDQAKDGVEALEKLKNEVFDIVVTDLKMPNMDGQKLLKSIIGLGFRCPVVMISALGDINDAVMALKSGASDYIIKPFEPEELIMRIKEIVKNFRRANEIEASERTRLPRRRLIGKSDSISKIRTVIEKVAKSDSTVLITGESGVGKEVVARGIHAASPRASEPFVAVNIGAVPENLMESELFGHEKGAFTGAADRKIGLFELAGAGTLFLDEVGEMPLQTQVKFLRVLQERKIRRLGGSLDIPIMARFLSATNQDIESMVEGGTFRNDLYYRLNVVRIDVPPLRSRMEDIPELAEGLVEKLCVKMSRPAASLSPAALELLMAYSFPGNIRELENILERALIFSEGNTVEPEFILIGNGKPQQAKLPAATLESIEEKALAEALKKWSGNRSKAAAELGISRGTLIKKIKLYGLE